MKNCNISYDNFDDDYNVNDLNKNRHKRLRLHSQKRISTFIENVTNKGWEVIERGDNCYICRKKMTDMNELDNLNLSEFLLENIQFEINGKWSAK